MITNLHEVVDKAHSIVNNYLSNVPDADQRKACLEAFDKRNEKILSHVPEMQQVMDLWQDSASKRQYTNFVLCKMLRKLDYDLCRANDSCLPEYFRQELAKNLTKIVANKGLTLPKFEQAGIPDSTIMGVLMCNFAMEQYRYPKLVEVTKDDVFLDCGSFIGDTAVWALQKGAKVHCFDPISANVQRLHKTLELNGYTSEQCVCHQFAVASQNQETTFKIPNNFSECSFNAQAEVATYNSYAESQFGFTEEVVQCRKLDDFLKEAGITPTFIKMDIEGAELDALAGAVETIQTLKPKLAICLYHHDSDLWTIPLYIKSLVPEYKFFCRENGPCCEFVLYATTEA